MKFDLDHIQGSDMIRRKRRPPRFHQGMESLVFTPYFFARLLKAKGYSNGHDRANDNRYGCDNQDRDIQAILELHAPKTVRARHYTISLNFSNFAFTGPSGVSIATTRPSSNPAGRLR